MRRLTVLTMMGLLTACNATSDFSNDVENSMNDGAAANVMLDGNAADALLNAGNVALDNAAAEEDVVVGSLPLRLGYYVADGTACDKATDATLTLLRRDGYGGARFICTYGKIEKTGPTSFRVEESCKEMGGFGGERPAQKSKRNYNVPDDASFISKSDAGWENKSRFCPQHSLPAPWKENDLKDVTG